jgi:Uma2 family endonuclease
MGASTTLITVEEFLKLPEVEGERLELIDGEVISMGQAGYPHELTKSNLIRVLTVWSVGNPPSRVFCETAYQVHDRNCLIPDLSLDSNRVAPGSTGIFQGAPELAIEVVSSESAARLEKKVRLYLSNGGKSVWTIYPEERMVRVYHPGRELKNFFDDQPLTDPSVLPGFSIPTSAIFEGV